MTIFDHEWAFGRKKYLEGSKMDNAVNGGVLSKNLIKSLVVGYVDLVEVGAAATDLLNTVNSDLGGVVQAVNNNDIVAVLEQGQCGERANVAGTTAKK